MSVHVPALSILKKGYRHFSLKKNSSSMRGCKNAARFMKAQGGEKGEGGGGGGEGYIRDFTVNAPTTLHHTILTTLLSACTCIST